MSIINKDVYTKVFKNDIDFAINDLQLKIDDLEWNLYPSYAEHLVEVGCIYPLGPVFPRLIQKYKLTKEFIAEYNLHQKE